MIDRFIAGFDGMVRAIVPPSSRAGRPSPSQELPLNQLDAADTRHSAGLMRVNHTGEVCAQALYMGQALVARDSALRGFLLDAASEERDHLEWCRARLRELESRPSVLDPAWYAGSMAIAVAAAAISDPVSLGFVEETERQVCAHLDGHLDRLSNRDTRSRAIVAAMRADEARHADSARTHGARELPILVKRVMSAQARIMTSIAYWI